MLFLQAGWPVLALWLSGGVALGFAGRRRDALSREAASILKPALAGLAVPQFVLAVAMFTDLGNTETPIGELEDRLIQLRESTRMAQLLAVD